MRNYLDRDIFFLLFSFFFLDNKASSQVQAWQIFQLDFKKFPFDLLIVTKSS